MKRTYDVRVFNQSFSVKSESDERYVREVATYVDQKIREMGQKSPQASSLNVALLAAMNIADEHFRSRQKKEERTEEVLRRVRSLIEFVSAQL